VKVLITGGAGFIGSHLSEAMLDQGHQVLIMDNLSTGSIDNIAHLKGRDGFEYFIDTVENEPLLAELIDRSDVVFHFAAAVGVKLIVEQPCTIETNAVTEIVSSTRTRKKPWSSRPHLRCTAATPFRSGRTRIRRARRQHPLRVQQGYRTSFSRRVWGAQAAGDYRPLLQHRRTASDRSIRDGHSEFRPAGAGG
jgi:hypothetical protein